VKKEQIPSAYIITIGDELLIGQVINTNSSWMADQLTNIGVKVIKMLTVQDDEKAIINAFNEAKNECKYIFISGGLGPTIDDITKRTIAKFMGADMEFNPEFYANVKDYLEKRGAKLDDMMYNYSFFPVGIKYLRNVVGTAPGMQFSKSDSHFFSMPGVPAEMKSIFTDEILPILKSEVGEIKIVKKTLLTAGEMEAALADRLKSIVAEMPENVSIAYLPNLGKVRIRITASGTSFADAIQLNEKFVNKIKNELGDIIYGYNEDVFEEEIGKLLKYKDLMLGTAESCTGGLIASKITSVSGSSEYFKGSMVAYANEVKINSLEINPKTLTEHGAVSEQTVTEMVVGAIKKLDVDIAIATSGIAGPTGGTSEKPVGTIWIACGNKNDIWTQKLQLGENRAKNIETTANIALNMCRRFLLAKC
jgi:nicotinamide-nucleotide amidase